MLTSATQSPLLSTVNFLSLAPIKPDAPVPPFDYTVLEDITPVAKAEELKGHPDKRKKWLSDSKGHEGITLGPDVLVRRFASSPRACSPRTLQLASDFCNGYIDFATLSLKIPGGLHFSLQNIWCASPYRTCQVQVLTGTDTGTVSLCDSCAGRKTEANRSSLSRSRL